MEEETEEFNFKHFKNSLGIIYCSLRYHERLRAITITWKNTAPEDDLEKVHEEVLKMIRSKKCLFAINDFQELYTNASEYFVHFLEKGWDNEIHAAGLRFVLHIWKEGVEKPPLSPEGAKFIKICSSKLDAVAWIKKQLKTI